MLFRVAVQGRCTHVPYFTGQCMCAALSKCKDRDLTRALPPAEAFATASEIASAETPCPCNGGSRCWFAERPQWASELWIFDGKPVQYSYTRYAQTAALTAHRARLMLEVEVAGLPAQVQLAACQCSSHLSQCHRCSICHTAVLAGVADCQVDGKRHCARQQKT